MTIIDRAVGANRVYARNYRPTLGGRPAPKLAVVTYDPGFPISRNPRPAGGRY